MNYPTVKQHPHAAQARAIVTAMLKLKRDRQRELFGLAIEYLHRQCGPQVGTLHDFINAEPDAIITREVKERLLGTIARAFKENDPALLP